MQQCHWAKTRLHVECLHKNMGYYVYSKYKSDKYWSILYQSISRGLLCVVCGSVACLPVCILIPEKLWYWVPSRLPYCLSVVPALSIFFKRCSRPVLLHIVFRNSVGSHCKPPKFSCHKCFMRKQSSFAICPSCQKIYRIYFPKQQTINKTNIDTTVTLSKLKIVRKET